MSNRTYLDRLLNGAQSSWKTLGDLGTFTYGYAEKANDIGDARFIRITDIGADGKLIPHSPKYVEISKESERFLLKKNDLLVARTGATFGKTMIFEEEYPAIYAGFLIRLNLNRGIIDPKFYWHFAQSELYWNQANKLVSGGGQPQFNVNALKKIRILLPCPQNPRQSLAIQAEIVRILEVFDASITELRKQLNAELIARRKQYQYYLDQLLATPEFDVEWKTFADVFSMRAGQHISAEKIVSNASEQFPYPCFGGNGIRGYVANQSHDGNFLLIGRQGALCGNVKRTAGRFYATEHAIVVSAIGVDVDWAFHLLKSMNLNQYASKSAQPGLAVGNLQQLKIPVPTGTNQRRVAHLLDQFEKVTFSLNDLLPREIALREKQYAYYRDLLLSFSKSDELAA